MSRDTDWIVAPKTRQINDVPNPDYIESHLSSFFDENQPRSEEQIAAERVLAAEAIRYARNEDAAKKLYDISKEDESLS